MAGPAPRARAMDQWTVTAWINEFEAVEVTRAVAAPGKMKKMLVLLLARSVNVVGPGTVIVWLMSNTAVPE